MDLRDFRTLATSGGLDQVVLHRRPEGDGYELWAFGEDFPPHLSNRLKVTRTNKDRTWSSVDRALSVIQREGWNGPVLVESPLWMPSD